MRKPTISREFVFASMQSGRSALSNRAKRKFVRSTELRSETCEHVSNRVCWKNAFIAHTTSTSGHSADFSAARSKL